MKETINIRDYAGHIQQMLRRGILLNTQTERFDSMVIGWGNLGVIWGEDTFIVYVRDSRYTKRQLDASGEFTVSIPLEDMDPEINRVCGSLSGRDTDKVQEAKLTLEPARSNRTPGIREYPITLECVVRYAHRLEEENLPEEILQKAYRPDSRDERDMHTVYIGKIVDAYIIK